MKWIHSQMERVFTDSSAGMVHRGIRHLIAGGIGTLIYMMFTFLFVELIDVYPVYAVIYAFMISVVYSYVVNKVWVYNSESAFNQIFPRFITVILLSLALNAGIMYLVIELFKGSYIIGLLLTVFVVPPTNFLLNYYWAFK